MSRVAPLGTCDSCTAPLQRNRVYIGCIGSIYQTRVCEFCAASAAAGQYTLYVIATARQIIRRHQRHLASAVAQ